MAINSELLIKACLRNESKAQYEFYKAYYGFLKSVAMRYAGSTDEAEDMLNEGFLKIFQNLHQYNFTGSFTSWMKTVMIHAAIDYTRKYKSYQNHVDMDSISEYETESYQVNDALTKMDAEDVLALVQVLPPVSRAVFNLYVLEGYSHKEIAKQLNIKEGTSHWHLNFAKNEIKRKIQNKQ